MTTAHRIALGGIGLLGVLGACRDPAEPSPRLAPHNAVYGVVQLGDTAVHVLAEELLDVGGRAQLRGASASLTGPGGTTALIEAAPSLGPCFSVPVTGDIGGEDGCYAGLLPQPLGASAALTLNMSLPEGGEIHGSLVTPAPPVVSIPPDSQHVTVRYELLPPDNLPIAIIPIDLEAAPGAARVDVVATVVRAFTYQGGGALLDPADCTVRSSTTPFRPPQLQGRHDLYLYEVPCENAPSPPWDSLDLSIHVVSMEDNYAGYADEVLATPALSESEAGFGLEGAVGVFGAMAMSALSLTLVYVK